MACDSQSGSSREVTSVASELEFLGNALVVLRLHRGLSQADLARLAGIRPNQVSRYETGQVLPQLAQLRRLLVALGLDLAPFFAFTSSLFHSLRRIDLIHDFDPGARPALHRIVVKWLEAQQDLDAGFSTALRAIRDAVEADESNRAAEP